MESDPIDDSSKMDSSNAINASNFRVQAGGAGGTENRNLCVFLEKKLFLPVTYGTVTGYPVLRQDCAELRWCPMIESFLLCFLPVLLSNNFVAALIGILFTELC